MRRDKQVSHKPRRVAELGGQVESLQVAVLNFRLYAVEDSLDVAKGCQAVEAETSGSLFIPIWSWWRTRVSSSPPRSHIVQDTSTMEKALQEALEGKTVRSFHVCYSFQIELTHILDVS